MDILSMMVIIMEIIGAAIAFIFGVLFLVDAYRFHRSRLRRGWKHYPFEIVMLWIVMGIACFAIGIFLILYIIGILPEGRSVPLKEILRRWK